MKFPSLRSLASAVPVAEPGRPATLDVEPKRNRLLRALVAGAALVTGAVLAQQLLDDSVSEALDVEEAHRAKMAELTAVTAQVAAAREQLVSMQARVRQLAVAPTPDVVTPLILGGRYDGAVRSRARMLETGSTLPVDQPAYPGAPTVTEYPPVDDPAAAAAAG